VVGQDTNCGWVITVNAGGSTSVTNQNGRGAYDGSEDALVGIVNNSDALVTSVTLQGSSDIFGFDGDGICNYGNFAQTSNGAYCASLTGGDAIDPNDYEGPNNTFTGISSGATTGTVAFTSALVPGGSTFFSLEDSPFTATATLKSDIVVSPSTVTATEGMSTGPITVATFADLPNVSPAGDFTATINWGDGTPLDNTGTISVGSGNYVVTGSHTYAEEGPYSTTVTVNDVNLAINYGTATGSATVVDAALTASTNPKIPNATTGKSFTAPVAAFTDANPLATSSDYTASINWGDNATSAGTISQPGGIGTVLYVSGTHTYAANGTYTVTVTVTDDGGAKVTITNTVTDYDAVISCGSSCAGSATVSGQTTGATSSSTTGTILLDLNKTPAVVGAFSCGDPFRHAALYSFMTSNGITASGSIALTVTFNNSAAAGAWWVPFAVCYDSPGVPFTTLLGQSKTLGLLPFCPLSRPGHPVVGPCVQSIRYSTVVPLPSEKGTVTEQLILPPNDPFSH
jgi:hypothetical protein